MSGLRVLYLGLWGGFSARPLLALLAAGMEVCGVVVPAASGDQRPIHPLLPTPSPSTLPIVNPRLNPTVVHLAWQRQIPVWEVGRPGAPETLATLGGLRPDVGCVACFSLRLLPALLALPPLGFLNVHPSLLPAYRGPAPLFWAFRQGEITTGVTVHFMDEGLDTGDVAMQASIPLPDGISGPAAEAQCATAGGELLVQTLQALQQGTLTRHPQATGGSYYPWPAAADFEMSTTWPARRAFNFMRGTAEWGPVYPVEVGGAWLTLEAAVSFTADMRLDAPRLDWGDDVWIQFSPGVLRARQRR
ncbi:MAG: formyltransferase family protein [Chloroflexota bacterium]